MCIVFFTISHVFFRVFGNRAFGEVKRVFLCEMKLRKNGTLAF